MFGFKGNLLLVTVVCAVIHHAATKELSEDQKKEAMVIATDCIAETGIKEDAVMEIMKTQAPPTSQEGKCFLKCIMEKREAFVDGEISDVSIQAWLEERIDDQGALTKAKEITEDCIGSTKNGDDKCEYVSSFSECLFTKFKEAGIEPLSV